MERIFDSTIKMKAQQDYCKKNKTELLAPDNGTCWFCKKNIYDFISFEEAKNQHITNCPCCNRSFCD